MGTGLVFEGQPRFCSATMLYIPKPSNKQTVTLITEVVGDTRRAENWSDPSLTIACEGELLAHSAVNVSFYFLLASPQVIVDMEPAPVVGKFYCEAKRRWAHARNIVYVPIFLRDKLTRTQFEERLKLEKAALEAARKEAGVKRRKAVARGEKRPQGYAVTDPEIQALIGEETLTRLQIEEQAGYKLRGCARDQRIAKIRRAVEVEFLARVRDGSVGHQLRNREPALAAR